MSWWDFEIGYAAGQEAAKSERSSGGGSGAGAEIILNLPAIAEMSAAAFGGMYLAYLSIENIELPQTVYLLIFSVAFLAGGGLYALINSIFTRNKILRLTGALISGVAWTGAALYVWPQFLEDFDGIVLTLIFFAMITMLKGYSLGLFEKSNTSPKKPLSEGKKLLLMVLLGPFALPFIGRNRDR